MKTIKTILLAAAVASSFGAAHAQMRVEGFKQVDPRLKQQRIETQATQLPPRITADQADAVAGVAVTVKTTGQAPKVATPALPVSTDVTAGVAPVALAVQQPRQTSAPGGQAGPLQRPTYLQPDQSQAPAGGPSALDLMKQCFDGSISGSIANPSCVGYMAGFVGAVRISSGIGPGYPICLPETGLSNESIVSDVSAYLEENTQSLQKSARSVVFLVLSKRYPCADK